MDRYNVMNLTGKMYARLRGSTDIVFLCLGTSKLLADAYGPMVGSLLKTKYNIATYVYGDLRRNINALNLEEYLDMIHRAHPTSHIIVVDSALGDECRVGTIRYIGCGTVPRSAVDDSFRLVGDSSILAIVEAHSKDFMLIKTKRSFVAELAETTACAINQYFALAKALQNNMDVA